jgi:hypothetical protein
MAQQISELGKGGWNPDIPKMILPLNVFSDVNNIRFDDESLRTTTGETTYQVISTAPTWGIHWQRPDVSYNIFVADGNITRVAADGTQTSMSPLTPRAADVGSKWQGSYFNGGFAIIINNGLTVPLYCLHGDPTAENNFTPLPNWNYVAGLTVTAKVVRSLNYSLVAANLTLNQDGVLTYAPGTIRVSVQASTGAIPTIWQPGITTDTADEFEISSTSPVLDMLELRGNMIVYSQEGINILTIGAATRVSPYSRDHGILATNCVVEFDGNHFVVDKNDIYAHSGSGGIKSLAEGRVKKYFFSNLNKSAADLVYVSKDKINTEILVNYPKGSSTVCNEALVYNYSSNTWSRRTLPGTTFSFLGPKSDGSNYQYVNDVVYMTTATTQTLVTDDGYLMWDGSSLAPYSSYVERKKLNSGEVAATVLIAALYPILDSVPADQDVTISVEGQDNYMQDVDLTAGGAIDFVFKPNNLSAQGYKVDPRKVGRVMNYRISSDGPWRMAALAMDVKPMGGR